MRFSRMLLFSSLVFLLPALPGLGQSPPSHKPEIIRDTAIAEGIEDKKPEKICNSSENKKNVKVGNFYYKQKNFVGATIRYLTAMSCEPDSAQTYKLVDKAYESLVKAYESLDRTPESLIKAEKQYGVIPTVIDALNEFLTDNPDSIKSDDIREKITKLTEISSQFDFRR